MMKHKKALFLVCGLAHCLSAAPIKSGQAYFQNQNIDALTNKPDDTYYPPLAAPDIVSVTTKNTKS